MGGKTKVTPAPAPFDAIKAGGEFMFGKDFGDVKGGFTDPELQQRLLESEATFRPQYQALELADQEAALFGTEDQAGLIELQRRAGEAYEPIEQAAKEREMKLLGEFGPQFTEAMRASDPESERLRAMQQQQAEALYSEAAGQLSPERAREAEQAARMAGASRGRVGDMSTIAGELLGREASRAQLRQQAAAQGQLGMNFNRATGGDPTAFLFGRPSQTTAMGSDLYGKAYNLAGQQAGPQLFDFGQGVNLGMQEQTNRYNLTGASMAARAQEKAGLYSGIGSILGGLAGR